MILIHALCLRLKEIADQLATSRQIRNFFQVYEVNHPYLDSLHQNRNENM